MGATTEDKVLEICEMVVQEEREEKAYWKSQAKIYRLIVNVSLLVILSLGWWMITTMAQAEAMRYETGDLAYPFVTASAVLVLIYIVIGFSKTLREIYCEELADLDIKLVAALEGLKQKKGS